jgi:hypothetical protein
MSNATYQICSCGNLFVADKRKLCSCCMAKHGEGGLVFEATLKDLEDSFSEMPEIRLWVVRADMQRAKKLIVSWNTMTFQDFALEALSSELDSRLIQEISSRQPAGKAMAQSKYFIRFDTFLSPWLVEGWNEMLKGLIDREDPELVMEHFIDTMLEEA